MPTFSRRNREKFMLTENVGFRSCERVVRASDLLVGQTLHRLGQIMPLVSETVNNVELARTRTGFFVGQTCSAASTSSELPIT